jgi:2-polyprenyl-3-methyl-5-hydroxy-6-metoxy-1,4-benzoquinol methylase
MKHSETLRDYTAMAIDNDITIEELQRVFHMKHANPDAAGWSPRMRKCFHYFTPDEHYEAMVARVVKENCLWLDVGCGHNIFPSNPSLAHQLASICQRAVGVDPDETIENNSFVHERYRQSIEDFSYARKFDVVTLRMVVEHFAFPEKVLATLSQLTKPGGKVVLYTVNKWALVPLLTKLLPFKFHHPLKKIFWNTEKEDTFPVFYRLNTRKTLHQAFTTYGFREEYFAYVDDCQTLARFRVTQFLELSSRAVLQWLKISYPENCLLGVYVKEGHVKEQKENNPNRASEDFRNNIINVGST